MLEFAGAQGVAVHPNGVALDLPTAKAQGQNGAAAAAAADGCVTARLLIDCMGNFSPIVRQARWGQRPDGVCLVVGTCSRGFPPEQNTTGAPSSAAAGAEAAMCQNTSRWPRPGRVAGSYSWPVLPAAAARFCSVCSAGACRGF